MFKNYTPHPLSIHTGDGVLELMPDGPAPRLTVKRIDLKELFGVPLVRSVMGLPENMPPKTAGIVYIVSALVAEACPDRDDLVYPGEAIRDKNGRIVGARGLCAGPGLASNFF